MDKFGLALLASQKDAKNQAQSALLYINQNNQFNKTSAQQFLDAILVQLKSSQTSPISKTMTLHMLKQITYFAEVKFFSLLMGHQALDFMYKEAKNIDPKKNLNEKGVKKFPNSPELGRQYMRVLLELMNFWGEKFAKGGNSQTTKFKKNLIQLKNSGVVLPSNYEYFDANQYKLRSKRSKQPTSATVNASNTSNPNNPQINNISSKLNKLQSPTTAPTGKISTQLKYTKEKIHNYMQNLQKSQNLQKTKQLIQINHTYFQKQKSKFQSRAVQVQNDQQAIADYFSLQHFLNQENNYYIEYVTVNDFQNYIKKVRNTYQTTFDVQTKKKLNGEANNFHSTESKIFGVPLGNNGTKPTITQTQTRPAMNEDSQHNSQAIINNFYSKIVQRSISPHSGFKAVQNELQKQKQLAKKNPLRKTSRSPRNLSRSNDALSRSNTTNLKQSKIHPIFTFPPNRNLSYKIYEGQTIPQNKSLARTLYGLKKQQGSRRFKLSNFRQKNPLFQNQQIQIGYKSQPVYQSINNFNNFILINLFIGNKTDQIIRQFKVEYRADQNQVLYTNPRNVDTIIPAGFQNKHDLMIAPVNVPYNLMTMHISYRFKDTGYLTSVILPNSVVKLASYMKISQQQLNSYWNSSKKYKTNSFRLCHYLAPQSFPKLFPVLQFSTRYEQFIKQGSETDLQMFCMVILLQKYQAILKINIRPNLDVVVQLGILDNNEEGIQYCRFYLQNLEFILKHINL